MRNHKKVDNPVSREIVLDSVYNRLDDYFPHISLRAGDRGYNIRARLPEAHRKWMSYINGLEGFREAVKREIEEVFSQYVFRSQSYLKIVWGPGGVVFKTDGIGCGVYIEGPNDYGYFSHNVDHYEQASVLFIALSTYLPKLYFAMEMFESGTIPVEKHSPFKGEIYQRIKLRQGGE